MPPYTASETPGFTGLYVDLFFDPPGKLSRLRIDDPGSGYDPNDPPTIEITGGGGNGANVIPTIIGDGGEILGVNFYRDPNLGDQRGEGYITTSPAFTFVSNTPPTTVAQMSCSLSKNTSLLNLAGEHLKMLRMCVEQGIDFLALEGLKYMDWSQSASTNPDAFGTAALRSFISRARTSGIKKISAAINGSQYEVDRLMEFQGGPSVTTQKFNAVTFKREYWRGYGSFSDFISKLTYLRNKNNLLPINLKLEIQVWLGWFTEQEAKSILQLSDVILLDDFSPTRQPDFKFMENRLEILSNAGSEVGQNNIKVYPIFSSESLFYNWNGPNEHLGEYFTSQNLQDAWYKWGRIPSGTFINGLSLKSFNSGASNNVKDRVNPSGLICYNYSQLRNSFEQPPQCVAIVNPKGPIFANIGDEVILSSSTVAPFISAANVVSYDWSNGDTGNTITAVTTGSYSLTVTYNTGCIATSNIVDIYFEECHANIEYEGPLVLNKNEIVVLSASSGSSWTWYRDAGSGFLPYDTNQITTVTHSDAGDFYVNVDNGLGCNKNSQTVTVGINNNEDCNVTIDSETPLFFASASSYSSVTLTVYPNNGSSYTWSDGNSGQSIENEGSDYYRVTVVGGTCGGNATSRYLNVSGTYSPIDQRWTDDNYPANWNSTLITPENEPDLFWTEYSVSIQNINSEKFYGFFKIRSINGKRTGIRFAVNKTNNFIPITGVIDTDFAWYRIEVDNIGLTQIIQNRVNNYYVQLINRFCELEEFIVSENGNLVPGPYPNFSYVG